MKNKLFFTSCLLTSWITACKHISKQTTGEQGAPKQQAVLSTKDISDFVISYENYYLEDKGSFKLADRAEVGLLKSFSTNPNSRFLQKEPSVGSKKDLPADIMTFRVKMRNDGTLVMQEGGKLLEAGTTYGYTLSAPWGLFVIKDRTKENLLAESFSTSLVSAGELRVSGSSKLEFFDTKSPYAHSTSSIEAFFDYLTAMGFSSLQEIVAQKITGTITQLNLGVLGKKGSAAVESHPAGGAPHTQSPLSVPVDRPPRDPSATDPVPEHATAETASHLVVPPPPHSLGERSDRRAVTEPPIRLDRHTALDEVERIVVEGAIADGVLRGQPMHRLFLRSTDVKIDTDERFILYNFIGDSDHPSYYQLAYHRIDVDDPPIQRLLVKIVSKSEHLTPEAFLASLRREEARLKALSLADTEHRYVARCLGVSYDERVGVGYIMMEDGLPLNAHLPRSQEQFLHETQSLLRTVEFLHAQGLVHRNLEEESFIVDDHGNIKLNSLASAVDLAPADVPELVETAIQSGTLKTAAPELLLPIRPTRENLVRAENFTVGAMLIRRSIGPDLWYHVSFDYCARMRQEGLWGELATVYPYVYTERHLWDIVSLADSIMEKEAIENWLRRQEIPPQGDQVPENRSQPTDPARSFPKEERYKRMIDNWVISIVQQLTVRKPEQRATIQNILQRLEAGPPPPPAPGTSRI